MLLHSFAIVFSITVNSIMCLYATNVTVAIQRIKHALHVAMLNVI